MLQDPSPERTVDGRRLLAVSRAVLARTLAMAFAWRMTGEDVFARKAEADLLAVADFTDWNPSHFLDVAEMTCACAIGYDWIHDALPPDSRQRIRQAIVDKGLKPALGEKKPWWLDRKNNWNQVCLGGLALGALAICEDEPDVARQILELVREHGNAGLAPYAPDGVYPEGPGYWIYGTSYEVLLIAALKSALGDDWNIPTTRGFLASADFMHHMRGPTGSFFSFADCSTEQPLAVPIYWFARELKRPELVQQDNALVKARIDANKPLGDRFSPLIPLWWSEPSNDANSKLFWAARGANPVAAWRSAWNDPKALYFAIKAGGANVSHGHMDAGTFVLDWGGVRWAEDLGMEDYGNLEGRGVKLWEPGQDSDRWRIFRIGSSGHNTITIGGRLHRADALSTLTKADETGAEIDMTPVLGDQAKKVTRQVQWCDAGVTVTDIIEGVKPGETIRWAMCTAADVAIEGLGAKLTRAGRKLDVAFGADNARLQVQSIEKGSGAFDSPNPGKRQLILEIPADKNGYAHITARFSPKP